MPKLVGAEGVQNQPTRQVQPSRPTRVQCADTNVIWPLCTTHKQYQDKQLTSSDSVSLDSSQQKPPTKGSGLAVSPVQAFRIGSSLEPTGVIVNVLVGRNALEFSGMQLRLR